MRRIWFIAALGVVAASASAQSFTESFNGTGGAPGTWTIINNSNPVGLTSWFQHNSVAVGWNAHSGGANDAVAANFGSTGNTGDISTWLLTPMVNSLTNGDTFSFWTRTVDAPFFPDRLQIRFSTAGSSTNVGSDQNSVGDFTNLLLDINSSMNTTDYPNTWTQFSVTLSGITGVQSGRFAFRYFVPGAGPRGDYIAVDDVSYVSTVPEPASMTALALGGLALLRRRRNKKA